MLSLFKSKKTKRWGGYFRVRSELKNNGVTHFVVEQLVADTYWQITHKYDEPFNSITNAKKHADALYGEMLKDTEIVME